MALRRPSPLLVFALSAFGWILVLTLAWSKVSAWTSYPVAMLTHVALEQGAPMWVRSVQKTPGHMQVETAVAIPVPKEGGRLAEIDVELDPGRYAYGLPIFLALLLAARDRHRLAKGVAGYLLLLPVQAFSATMFVLMQLVISAQASASILALDAWQIEAIVYGYQLGSLVLPTLAPIVLWLWLDRQFFTEVMVRGWHGNLAPEQVISDAPSLDKEVPNSALTPDAEPSKAQSAPHVAPSAGSAGTNRVPPSGAKRSGQAEVSSSASAGLPPRQ